jgi:ABC-type nitrate/sulfonate/bicarbonate transport system substrate-binding protein
MRQPITTRVRSALAVVAAVPVLIAAGATTEPDAEPIRAERCESNRDAGTITYLTGFDYAAAASMVDVFVAEQRGYFDELCLDVQIVASFSTANYPLVAGGEAHFASAGSFSEVLNFAAANDAELVALVVEGRFPIDALIAKPGVADSLEDFEGRTIGVKGALPPSIAAMLATAGLVEGEDYDTVLLDGFDPVAHIALDGIAAFPGYKSNEPGALDRADVDYELFDPIDYDVPGSFGVIYTSRDFLDEHPAAAQDFARATMRGLADALADPAAAAQSAFDLVDEGGNPNFLSPEGETYRWETDAGLLLESYGDDVNYGVPDVELLQTEVDAYAEVGLFGDEAPDIATAVDVDVVAEVYDEDGEVIWPG